MTIRAQKILVIEDNELNSKLIQHQLEKLGYKDFVIFSNGDDALEWFQNHHCDLILTDCQMHPMDGYELTKTTRVSHHKNASTIPIIAITASATPENIEHCLSVGMNDCLTKPIQLASLERMLGKWLHHNGPRNENAV